MSSASDKAAEIQRRREERKKDLEAKREEQYLIDLAALEAAEMKHGDSCVKVVLFEFIPGLPTFAIVQTPDRMLMKRFHTRLKPSKNQQAGAAAVDAAEELAPEIVVYPNSETVSKMQEARPGFLLACGNAGIALAESRDAVEGKA